MIEKDLERRILILDGAMGTMLQASGIKSECADMLNLSHPEVIEDIHSQYISAGADILETNTFNLCGYEATRAGAQIARKAADMAGRKVYVAGVLGPHSEGDIFKAYEENARALIDGGCDLIMIETVFYPINLKIALYTLDKIFSERGKSLPVMVSATINDKSGRLLTGTAIDALYNAISHFPIISFGLNCSFGAAEMVPFIEQISEKVSCAVSMHPNAGLPNHLGEYDQSPETMAEIIRQAASRGMLNIAGGCCGTTPDHIKAIASALKKIPPRRIVGKEDDVLTVSGLETVTIDLATQNFVNVGERTNVAGSKKFARLISEKNYEEASSIARKQVEDGANIIDINMDDPLLDAPHEMDNFIRFIQNDPAIAKAAVMIDSSDWNTVVAGLKAAPGRCIVNSISLKNGEEEFLQKAGEIRRFGAAAIVMAFDEEGQATDYDRKINICRRAYDLLTKKAGYRPCDIIFDVNVLTIGTGMASDRDYAVDFIKAVKWIKENLPGSHTSGGVSNLSFAFRGNNAVREAMHSAFLYHAIAAGLDMAIVNPSMLLPYTEIEPELLKAVEDVIFNSDEEATARLVQIAGEIKARASDGQTKEKEKPWRALPFEKRLEYALRNGTEEYLVEDLNEALEHMSALRIIDGPLLNGMENVGELFSEGKMFLPQVVKAAKTMRAAVEILQPEIEKEKGASCRRRKKMILATVKGDVHDIGKNILGIVLSCNDIDIIDLGVMVENQAIIEAISTEDADFVGVSGLITPSLKEMENLCHDMEKAGCNIPLFVGGATTTALHTALKLAPAYSGGVVYTNSASDCANMLAKMIRNPEECKAGIKQEQEKLKHLHLSNGEEFISVEEARKRAPHYDDFRQSASFGKSDFIEKWIDPALISDHIDWRMFLAFWGFRESSSEEAVKTLEAGKSMLRQMIEERQIEISCIAKFFDAHRSGDDIVLPEVRLGMHRSTSTLTEFESLADFFSEDKSTRVGLFAVKVEDHHKCCCDCRDYDHLMRESLCARLAEGAAQWLQLETAPDGNVIRPAFGYSSCPDHSLKEKAFFLLNATEELGIRLTGNYAMLPESSVCGMLISHPNAKYVNLREQNESK
ncbi:MAG: methionine synthase [Bacteroidales bacterium]|nr:methionine synthase [Candidatus Cacconaster equi]